MLQQGSVPVPAPAFHHPGSLAGLGPLVFQHRVRAERSASVNGDPHLGSRLGLHHFQLQVRVEILGFVEEQLVGALPADAGLRCEDVSHFDNRSVGVLFVAEVLAQHRVLLVKAVRLLQVPELCFDTSEAGHASV